MKQSCIECDKPRHAQQRCILHYRRHRRALGHDCRVPRSRCHDGARHAWLGADVCRRCGAELGKDLWT